MQVQQNQITYELLLLHQMPMSWCMTAIISISSGGSRIECVFGV
jgi:hypothetical protein